jgi:pyruvyl transferase EpsO
MTYQEKISELKNIIHERLTPLITNDYVLLGLPYHPNIGDSLIWEGSETFLKTTPYKCLYTASVWSYNSDYRIPQNAIIIINGGGSFGDIWRHNTKFWLSLVQKYPHNKIIILPQSIHYKDEKILKEDAEIFSKHKNLTICLRDKNSIKIANQYFLHSKKILVPDMAFCMDITKWEKYIKPASDKILFLNRKDPEKKQNLNYDIVPANAEVLDWPTMEETPFSIRLYYKAFRFFQKIDRLFSTHISNSFSDVIYKSIFRKSFIKEGVSFLSLYSEIYTTRLHTAILAILLQKSFVWFDNSYGKSSAFYDTWLSDVENIEFIRE